MVPQFIFIDIIFFIFGKDPFMINDRRRFSRSKRVCSSSTTYDLYMIGVDLYIFHSDKQINIICCFFIMARSTALLSYEASFGSLIYMYCVSPGIPLVHIKLDFIISSVI